MSDYKVEFSAMDAEAYLPSLQIIVQKCASHGYDKNGLSMEITSQKFWVKYGFGVTLGEALTQNHVAHIVNADPTSIVNVPYVYFVFSCEWYRYIIMEYVEGDTVMSRQQTKTSYRKIDVADVANVIKRLIAIKMPQGTPPGHIGGGFIGHSFFDECKSTSEYPTVQALQDQINRMVKDQRLAVDFDQETKNGLVLCPDDIHPSNFIIPTGTTGKVIAIDFGRTGCMPPSYVSYSLETAWDPFTRLVAQKVDYPLSSNVHAMQAARYLVMCTGNNSLCIEDSIIP